MKLALIGTPDKVELLLKNHPLEVLQPDNYATDTPWEEDIQLRLLKDNDYDLVIHLTEPYRGEFPHAFTVAPGVNSVVFGLLGRPVCEVVTATKENHNLFTYNDLPGFFQQKCWEIAAGNGQSDLSALSALAQAGIELQQVPERPGLVTPRVLARIINEAFFMLGEGSATAEAIDQAMRLGVNYPKGPFAWAKELGEERVVAVLRALQCDLGKENYKVAPALLAKYASQ